MQINDCCYICFSYLAILETIYLTWIFGSFLVTSCALTSSHVLISKQENGSLLEKSGPTCMYPEGDHVINMRSDLKRVQRIESLARDTQPIRGVSSSLMIRLVRGCKHWHPWLPEEGMGQEEVPSLSISLHIILKPTTNWVPLSKIRWEIYFL